MRLWQPNAMFRHTVVAAPAMLSWACCASLDMMRPRQKAMLCSAWGLCRTPTRLPVSSIQAQQQGVKDIEHQWQHLCNGR